ncbi:hypothetical protein Q4E93_00485 [Flavitalea sp. BT771]|uniref:Ig-like domain-containing protein n=1 Tax=Flavitalea sp. BT771 TaxID=3063329 RepID=UPI0026E2D221|nr:hypothetical protein [Flavitalea sp. BT771]MDO6429040.1 hypothetical protein [Flavitalea sp. BT771]MDV6218832.1 hypothetical protein [Flavitalea sp. BT771]
MRLFTQFGLSFSYTRIWKPYALNIRSFACTFLFFILLFSGAVVAQTFPSPSSCTSKDLSLVAATLPSTPCETCTPGTTITKPLTLGINNKTGSTRTSFAFWANLTIINANGSIASQTAISMCFSTIPKNSTTSYLYGNLTYQCGQSLELTDIWEAWTDASPGSTCPVLLANTSTINPKCGTNPLLNIVAGLDANFDVTNATCTNLGSIKVKPFGGKAPYKVALGNNTPVSVAAGDSVTFSNLAAGTYNISLTDANNCPTPVVKSRTITTTGSLAAPTSGGDQTQCHQSPIQTLTATATATAGTITWYNAASGGSVVASPTLSSVGTITYYAQASNGTCTSPRTAVTLTINAAPAAPTTGGDQTQCQQSPIQTLTATATGGTITWYNAASAGSVVASPTLSSVGTVTYYAQSSNGTCSSLTRTPVTLTINAAPAAPTSGGDQTQCQQSPIQTLTATATGGTITWYNAASGGSIVASPTLSSVGTVTYYAQSSNGSCSSLTRTPVSLTINAAPAAPTSGGDQTQCQQSPIQTLTATATGGTITWYNAASGGSVVASPTLSSTGTVTYYAQSSNGTCSSLTRTPVSLTINAAPPTPSATLTQPTCLVTTGTITVTAPTGMASYTVTGTNPVVAAVTHAGAEFAGLTPGVYDVTATDANGCTSVALSVTINAQPAKPSFTVCLVQPTLCANSGSVTINATGGSGFTYSIDGTDFTNTTGVFNNLGSGSVTSIQVKNSDGCISAPANCDAVSNCSPQQTVSTVSKAQTAQMQPIQNASDQTSVNAYPNPFTSHVKFVVNAAHAGNGTLEVFNTLGQRVKIVYQGFVPAGVNNFDLNLPGQKNAGLIYRFSLGAEHVTGKLLQLKR